MINQLESSFEERFDADVVAIIVARSGSRRVPKKALQLLGTSSLIERKIHQLKSASYVSRICVGSDSLQILDLARSMGADTYKRRAEYCDEISRSANDMIRDMLGAVSNRYVLWAHLTNPFVDGKIYDEAIKCFLDKLGSGYDSLVSVGKIQNHLWDASFAPVNHNPWDPPHHSARELPPYYFQNGAIFIQARTTWMANPNFVGRRPYFFEMNDINSFDINTPHELELARAWLHWQDFHLRTTEGIE